jgi:hypothetical protein
VERPAPLGGLPKKATRRPCDVPPTSVPRRRAQFVESLLRWPRSGIELTLEHCFESARP